MKIGIIFSGISHNVFGKNRDVLHCYNNINNILISKLKEQHNVNIYITTYNHDNVNKILEVYNPKKFQLLEYNNSNQLNTRISALENVKDENNDFYILLRFDLHFNIKYENFNLDFNKFNFVCREGNNFWENQKFTSDTFYGFPSEFLIYVIKSFYDLKTHPYLGHTHGLYPELIKYITEDKINFMMDTFQLSGHEFASLCNDSYVLLHKNNFKINEEVLEKWILK